MGSPAAWFRLKHDGNNGWRAAAASRERAQAPPILLARAFPLSNRPVLEGLCGEQLAGFDEQHVEQHDEERLVLGKRKASRCQRVVDDGGNALVRAHLGECDPL